MRIASQYIPEFPDMAAVVPCTEDPMPTGLTLRFPETDRNLWLNHKPRHPATNGVHTHPLIHGNIRLRPPTVRHSTADANFQRRLEDAVSEHLDRLRKATHTLTSGTSYYNKNVDDILHHSVCGRATSVLQLLLERSGFFATKMATRRLPFGHVAEEHGILVVSNLETGTVFIVDPTWQQFLKILSPRDYPENDVLIIRKQDIQKFVEDLNFQRFEWMHEPPRREYTVYQMTDAEFTTFFAQIWNLELYDPVRTKTLDIFLREYRATGRALTPRQKIMWDRLIDILNFK